MTEWLRLTNKIANMNGETNFWKLEEELMCTFIRKLTFYVQRLWILVVLGFNLMTFCATEMQCRICLCARIRHGDKGTKASVPSFAYCSKAEIPQDSSSWASTVIQQRYQFYKHPTYGDMMSLALDLRVDHILVPAGRSHSSSKKPWSWRLLILICWN